MALSQPNEDAGKQRIAERKPLDTKEALACMREDLERFYAQEDDRAVFLRTYYVMTTEVHAAAHGRGDFDKPIFFDPDWVDRLAGVFSRLYFESQERPACKAWEMAHAWTRKERSSVLQNMVLGINAHINFDLAFGIHELILRDGDHHDPLLMARRKFDHDQINNVLMRCNPKIQKVLAREFGGGMGFFSSLFGNLDELLTFTGLRYYRDRVWNNVLALLAARDEVERDKVRMRLDWESRQMAEVICESSLPNSVVWGLDGLLRRESFKAMLQLEEAGGVHAEGPLDHRLQRPF